MWVTRSSRDLASLHLEPSAHCRWGTVAMDPGSAAFFPRIDLFLCKENYKKFYCICYFKNSYFPVKMYCECSFMPISVLLWQRLQAGGSDRPQPPPTLLHCSLTG